ncbi:MAG: hypothetical protein NUW21_02865 [Elusimicrobia bacterium]|nr:hypothetical protein [Elusimicrobiota bacterium]
MAAPLCLLLVLALLAPSPAPAQTLDEAHADGRRAWDGAAVRSGGVATGAAGGKRPGLTAAATNAPAGRLVARIDAMLAAPKKDAEPVLSALLAGVKPLTLAHRRQLLEWREEIRRDGEFAWFSVNAPQPSARDRELLAGVRSAVPGAPAPVFFLPFRPGGEPSLFGRVVGPVENASGFVCRMGGRQITLVDSGLPQVDKWFVTIHELIHTRHADPATASKAMNRLVREGAGRCESPDREVDLLMYLNEGLTQRLTLQVAARLLRAGVESRSRSGLWASVLSAVGAAPARRSTRDEIVGEAMLADFAELSPDRQKQLEKMAPPEVAAKLDDVYAQRVVVAAAAMREPEGARSITAWVGEGDAAPLFARLGRERVVVASYAASVAASMEKLAGLADDHPVFPASAALLKSALQPVAAPAAVSAQGADLLMMLSRGRGLPAPPATKLQAWRRDFACQPMAVSREISGP